MNGDLKKNKWTRGLAKPELKKKNTWNSYFWIKKKNKLEIHKKKNSILIFPGDPSGKFPQLRRTGK